MTTSPDAWFKSYVGQIWTRLRHSAQYEYGLCSRCDRGLNDKAEFFVVPDPQNPVARIFVCCKCYREIT